MSKVSSKKLFTTGINHKSPVKSYFYPKVKESLFYGFSLSFLILAISASAQNLPRLEVSSNHRYLVQKDGTTDGKPFFYLGDTGWELFTRITKAEVEKYFQVRKEQGFNAVLVDPHNEVGEKGTVKQGINYPNREGFKPFVDEHPFIPEGIVEEYWKHFDWVINKAGEYGLYITALPYLGNLYVQKERMHLIVSNEQAYNWGYFLGNRYKDKTNIIWALGGDFEPKDYKTGKPDQDEYMISIATAEGIADGINGASKQFDGGKADYTTSLMTYHINVPLSSSQYFHDADFLDFNSIQSGQNVEGMARNYKLIAADYNRTPVKPTLDMEFMYEFTMRRNGKTNQWELPRCSAFDVRRNAYRSVLAGGMGLTYGNNNVWMFYRKNDNYDDKYNPTGEWDGNEGIYSDGAKQMLWLKNLFVSRPFYKMAPSSSLITDTFGGEVEATHILASLEHDHGFAIIYIPTGQVFNVDLTQVNGNIACWWFNPVNGKVYNQKGSLMKRSRPFKTISRKKKTVSYQFVSPTNHDWILILDDASRKLLLPGSLQ